MKAVKALVILAVVAGAIALAGYGVISVDSYRPPSSAYQVRPSPDLSGIQSAAMATANASMATANAAGARQTAVAATATTGANSLVAEAQAGLIQTQAALEMQRQSALAAYDAQLAGAALQQAQVLATETAVGATETAVLRATDTYIAYQAKQANAQIDMLWRWTRWAGFIVLLMFGMAVTVYIVGQIQRRNNTRSNVFSPSDVVAVRAPDGVSFVRMDLSNSPVVQARYDGQVIEATRPDAIQQAEIARMAKIRETVAALPGISPDEQKQLARIVLQQVGQGETPPYKIYSGGIEQLPDGTRRKLDEAWRTGLLGSGEGD